MKRLNIKKNIFRKNRAMFFVLGFFVCLGVLVGTAKFVQAAWEEPSAQAPAGNIYAPLTAGPGDQAKKGHLILDPLYNPFGDTPTTNYPLDVRGTKDVYINTFNLVDPGNLAVDTDTLNVSGANDNVGIGTASPSAAVILDVVSGSANAGSATTPITTGSAISVNTADANTAATGNSTGNQPAVSGASVTGPGVYGLNSVNGSGIYAYSNQASAVVGIINSPYNPSNVIAAVYGEANGMGAWAGYFQQRLYGSGALAAGKFIPNRLQQSRVPYTAGWPMGTAEDSELIGGSAITFDGVNLWFGTYDWEPRMYVVDPDTMAVVARPVLLPVDHGINKLFFHEGFVWALTDHDGDPSLVKFDPATYQAVAYYSVDTDATAVGGPIDMTYDNVTPGGPYFWTISKRNNGNDVQSRIKTDGTGLLAYQISSQASIKNLVTGVNGTGNSCWTMNLGSCTDRLDTDTDNSIDTIGWCVLAESEATCAGVGGTWTPGVCVDRSCGDQASCTGTGAGQCDSRWVAGSCTANPATCGGTWNGTACSDARCATSATCTPAVSCSAGTWRGPDTQCANILTSPAGTPDNDERVSSGVVGDATGITFDGTYVWTSYYGGGNSNVGEGFTRVLASDPSQPASQKVFCSGPATGPSDATFDDVNNKIWLAYSAFREFPQGNRRLVKFNPASETVEGLYDGGWGGIYDREDTISFYRETPGGPSVWVGSKGFLEKFDTDGVEQNHYGEGPWDRTLYDFTYDPRDPSNPIIWQGFGRIGSVGKRTMEAPYVDTTVPILGAGYDDFIFDGTYLWGTASASTYLSKYRASDGKKISDYDMGFDVGYITFDGASLWLPHAHDFKMWFRQVDPKTGLTVDEYELAGLGEKYVYDLSYDGAYLWASLEQDSNYLLRIDLSSCSPGSHVCTSYTRYTLGGYIGVNERPHLLAQASGSIWASLNNSRKVVNVRQDGAFLSRLSIAEMSTQSPGGGARPIRSIMYDGTYLWVGSYFADADGNSIYKIDPYGGDSTHAGVCSNNTTLVCNTPADCGGNDCNAVVAAKYSIFKDGDTANVTTLTFDGTYVWATHVGYHDISPAVGQCSDHLDNDGNSLCDFDGGIGNPGCSGKPDPGCSSALDTSEETSSENNRYLTRIAAATDQIVESVTLGTKYDTRAAIFDGNSLWITSYGLAWYEGYSLKQYYVGSGRGAADLAGSVQLRDASQWSVDSQPGSFSADGSAAFGAKLTVVGDLVVANNAWAGAADDDRNTGQSCQDGQYVKGIDLTSRAVSFGTSGYIREDGMNGSTLGWGIAVDESSVYLAGNSDTDINTRWRAEKRDIWSGTLDTGFDGDGIITGAAANGGSNAGWDVAIDDTYLYTVGQTPLDVWHIEKRAKTNGSQAWALNAAGGKAARAIAIDSQYMYVTGQSSSNTWRTEKRLLGTGDLCTAAVCGTAFDGDGYVESSALTSSAHDIDIDDASMYVFGFDENLQWRIEKRLLTDGSLDSGFGSSGVITETTATVDDNTTYVGGISVDSDYLYVAGMDNANWHIRKYDKDNGSLCTGGACSAGNFGDSGSGAITVVTNIADGVNSIAIDDDYMYLIGYRSMNDDGWYMEKRRLDTGALCTAGNCGIGFGDSGSGSIAIYSNANPNDVQYGRDIAIDDTYIYTFGNLDGFAGWRIEKRNLANGALDNVPATLKCRGL
ncbi:MAG: hypothetical protein V1668_01715 [Patescibacteria group bacterium]